MALLALSSDYTDRDFDALLTRAKGMIRSVFPTWTDTAVADFANLLVEWDCFTADVLGFYQDQQAGEAFWPTAQLRENLLALARLVGFTPSGATAATVDVTFTLSTAVLAGRTVTFNPPTTPTPLNPTVVKTEDAEDPVVFQLLEAATITAGNTTVTASVENSELQGPETTPATGLPSQEVQLTATPYLDDSAVVSAGNGAYTQVASLLQSGPADRHYVVIVDERDRARVRFGDGATGAIPTGDISVSYKTGGGSAGNVGATAIRKIEGTFVDSAGDPVTVTVNNVAAASGGTPRDTVEEIREKVPESIRTLTRTVSRVDFETNAKRLSSVERALMLTKNEDGTLAENTGQLIIVPAGPGFPSTDLKNAALNQVVNVYPCTLTFTPSVVDPQFVDIGVKATIFLKQGYVAATVQTAIFTALKNFFALRKPAGDPQEGATNELIDFGFNLKTVAGAVAGSIALSDVFNVIRDVEGVRKVGDGVGHFELRAYRVVALTDSYTGGAVPATIVQAYAHTDVPIQIRDFPRLKAKTFGGTDVDCDLTIDGVPFPP